VLKVDCQGKLDIQGRNWRINRSLAGEWVQVGPAPVRGERRPIHGDVVAGAGNTAVGVLSVTVSSSEAQHILI